MALCGIGFDGSVILRVVMSVVLSTREGHESLGMLCRELM